MDELKVKYQQQEPAVRYGIAAAAVVVGLLVVVKILPALVAAMGIGLLIAIFFVPYWLPTIIAFKRNHPSKGGILVVNFLFGWTFVGWVLSLVWSLSDNGSRNTNTVIVQNHVNTHVAAPQAPAPQATAYQIGDVVNGHQFTGTAWIPLPPGGAQPLPPAAGLQLPAQPQPHQSQPAIEPR